MVAELVMMMVMVMMMLMVMVMVVVVVVKMTKRWPLTSAPLTVTSHESRP